MPSPHLNSERNAPLTAQTRIRRPDIQGLRAIAVLMVVGFHAGLPMPGGFVGVDVFFVISGFVITSMLHREWLKSGHIKFGHFYWRRFKRLTPALALVVSVTMLVSTIVLSPFGPQQVASATGIGAMLLSANLVIARTTGGYFGASAENNPLLNTWSLSVEEQFYLVLPAVIVLGWLLAKKYKFMRFSPAIVIAFIVLSSFTLAVLGSSGPSFRGSGTILGFYSPISRAWEFALGALLALALQNHTIRSKGIATALGLIGLTMIAASLWLITEATPFPGIWTLLPVSGTLFVLFAGTCTSASTSKFLSTSPLVKLGDFSYSIYLWHWPFIVFAILLWPTNSIAALIATFASIIPAIISYQWLEQPIRNLKGGSRWQMVSLFVLTLLVPIALANLLGQGAKNSWGNEYVKKIQTGGGTAQISFPGCMELGADPKNCTWNESSRGTPIYLMGDSNAAMYAEVLANVAEDTNRPLQLGVTGGCPFLDVHISIRMDLASDSGRCRDDYEARMDHLLSQDPGLVLLAQSNGYVYEKGIVLGNSKEGLASDESARVRAMQEGMRGTIRQLNRVGHKVLLIMPTYRLDESPNSLDLMNCTNWQATSGKCDKRIPITAAPQPQQWLREALEELAADEGVPLLDFTEMQCPNDECSLFYGDTLVYSDITHLSRTFSLLLAPILSDAIEEIDLLG